MSCEPSTKGMLINQPSRVATQYMLAYRFVESGESLSSKMLFLYQNKGVIVSRA
jgi:hypothetical protein